MDYVEYKNLIETRLAELNARARGIESELDQLLPTDLSEQAIELEDDEVLESLGSAAEREITLLNKALARMETQEYGVCHDCGNEISSQRLKAVLYAVLCRKCAASKNA